MSGQRIIWLASYPKSGNTWLRAFLTAYRTGAESIDINSMDATQAALRRAVDQIVGIDTADLLNDELRSLLPMTYRLWAASSKDLIFLKTHDSFCRTKTGDYLFPVEATQSVIHIIRDPRDVAVSASHHWGICLDKAIDRLNDKEFWIATDLDNPQIPQYLSDWSRHAESWMKSPLRTKCVRYEDMSEDPTSCFSQILEFLGFDVDPTRLQRAILASSFSRLQMQESRDGFSERLANTTSGFFRKGKVGGWRTVLSTNQADRIVQSHEPLMKKLAYLD